MLIDMDDTILSAHGHPEIAWNIVATEFAGELGQLSPRQVADAIADTARQFWAVAQPAGRCRTTSRSASPTASLPIATSRCSSSPARMTRSMR
jgi:hypothetical protein